MLSCSHAGGLHSFEFSLILMYVITKRPSAWLCILWHCMQLVRRWDTASTAARRAGASTTRRAVRRTGTATAVMAGSAPPAISRVLLTCTGLAVHAPAAVSMEVDATRSLDGVPVRRDTSENTASSVRQNRPHNHVASSVRICAHFTGTRSEI